MRKETMSSGRVSALRRLTEMDARFQTTVPIPLSMCPARTQATSLHDIGEALLTDALDPSLMQAFADGLCLMVATKVDQFPERLLLDSRVVDLTMSYNPIFVTATS